MKDALYLLDGYGLIYRSYFAFLQRPLTDKNGVNISAVFGFFNTLFSLKREFEPHYLAVAMDSAEPTFRHRIYPEYKATRDRAPEDLHAQVPLIEDLLSLLGVRVLRAGGYEADDIMGSLAAACRLEERPCFLVSADKDLMQLVGGCVEMLRPQKGGGFRRIDSEQVLHEKGVRPEQIIDFLALVGDSSDNIPGVMGIGEKSAVSLLTAWESLDALYENLDEAVQGSKRSKLEEGRENALLSRLLATIPRDVPLDAGPSDLKAFTGDFNAAAIRLRESGLNRLGDELAPDPSPSASFTSTASYTAILSTEDLDAWMEKIERAGTVALDTETDGLDPMQSNLVGLSFAVEPGEAAYLPLLRPDGPCLDAKTVRERLQNIFADGSVKIVGQNFKYDMKILARWGLTAPAPCFDTMLAAWMLDSGSPVNMDILAERYLNRRTIKFSDVVPKNGVFSDVSLDDALLYAAEDADITLQLYLCFRELLAEDPSRLAVFRNIEMPLLPLLASMEQAGIILDAAALEDYGRELEGSLAVLEKEIHTLCGREFNIASPKQLQEVLFVDRKLTPTKKIKTGWSTDNSVLVALAKEDPVPEKILLHRSLAKLKSTYVDSLPELVHPETGRIHTSYGQTGASTGRLSSKDPNLQNIPIRDENGRRIRAAFKPASGFMFVSADYSQIELVVLAHMSGDEHLRRAFLDGVDVHAGTAARLFGLRPQDVNPEQRRIAKVVNFGVMYGMSSFRLSNELGMDRSEAGEFIRTYFATYSGVKDFVDLAVAEAETNGGVRTLYGRFRPLPGINSSNRVEKAAAERAAVNSRIQGTAADIMKIAMLRISKVLEQRKLRSRILLQVHDELLLETPHDEVDALIPFLRQAMEEAVELSLPLRVNVETGLSWGDIH